jgi:thiol-disulfide isomerase/thioredoxin
LKITFKISVSTFLFFCVLSCADRTNNSFSLSGTIKSAKNQSLVLSKIEDITSNTSVIMDSIQVNRKGEFNVVYILRPGIYSLKFNTKSILLAIDKGQQLKIKGKDFEHLKINGSKDTKLLLSYEKFRKESLKRLVTSVRLKIKNLKGSQANFSTIAKLRDLEVYNYKLHLEELMNFIKEKMGTSIAIYATSTRWIGGKHLSFLDSLVNAFDKKHPKNKITLKLKKRLNILKRRNIGTKFPNIMLTDSSNTFKNLDSITGKIKLIDFWASWCPPCRTESVLLNQLYKKYHPNGFVIYSISLDTKRKNWVNAIKKDHRIWVNVSSLKGFDTDISNKLGITSLPFNLLLDEQNNIIGVNIFGNKLTTKINQLFTN